MRSLTLAMSVFFSLLGVAFLSNGCGGSSPSSGGNNPTRTPTSTAVASTATFTQTATPSVTATNTRTSTPTMTSTSTIALTPTATRTWTPDTSLPMGIYIAPYSNVSRVTADNAATNIYAQIYLAVDQFPVVDAHVTIGITSCCSVTLIYSGSANGVAQYSGSIPTYLPGDTLRVLIGAGFAGNASSDFVTAPGNITHTGISQSSWTQDGTGDTVSVHELLPGPSLTYQGAADLTSPHTIPGSAYPRGGNYRITTLCQNQTTSFTNAAAGSGFRVQDFHMTHPVIP